MKKVEKIFLEQVIEDHVFEILDESIIQIDELIWEDGNNRAISENSKPNNCRRSKYLHDQGKIVKEIFKDETEVNQFLIDEEDRLGSFEINSIVVNFDSKGNNSSTEIYIKKNLYCTWVFEYDISHNLICRKYTRNEYVQHKYLYEYDNKGNLVSSKYYTDNDSGSGNYYLDEEKIHT